MSAFNAQILVDKLAKLNNSQQSIETLSHWCIFHRNKSKQVVETWGRQFYFSPRDQRVSFLYLANDILQNSRRKGLEFVGEFWKVLPDALTDVIENGDEFGKNAAMRLVDIWEERKVFGSRGQILKEELNRSKNGKSTSYKLKHSTGDTLEKLISCYEHVNDGSIDENALFGKCQSAISLVEKLETEIGSDFNLDINGPRVVELQGQHEILRECIEQLKAAESSRSTLMSQLREVLHEQESKVDEVRNQLQVARSKYDKVGNILLSGNISKQSPAESASKEAAPESNSQEPNPTPTSYTQHQGTNLAEVSSSSDQENMKTAAAAVAAKLTASTSSAQMLSYVLSSLASESVISGQSAKEDYPSDGKRQKLDNGGVLPLQAQQPQPPPPQQTPFPQPMQHSSPMSLASPSLQPPFTLPPMVPPPQLLTGPTAPSAATQFTPTGGPMFSYSSPPPLQRPAQYPISYPMIGMPAPFPIPPNPYHGFQGSEGGNGGFFGQPPLPAASPSMSQQ